MITEGQCDYITVLDSLEVRNIILIVLHLGLFQLSTAV